MTPSPRLEQVRLARPFAPLLTVASLISFLFASPVFLFSSPVLLFASSVLLFASPVLAEENHPFEGLYFGGQLQYTNLPVSSSGSFGPNSGDLDGVGGGAFLGAELMIGSIYDAIEFEIGFDGSSDSYDLAPGDRAKAKGELSLGVHYRAGYVFEDKYLLYGRLGWQITRFKELTPHLSETKHLQGVRFGGGLETILDGPMALRVEYSYTWYRDPIHKPGQDLDIGQHLLRVGIGFHLF